MCAWSETETQLLSLHLSWRQLMNVVPHSMHTAALHNSLGQTFPFRAPDRLQCAHPAQPPAVTGNGKHFILACCQCISSPKTSGCAVVRPFEDHGNYYRTKVELYGAIVGQLRDSCEAFCETLCRCTLWACISPFIIAAYRSRSAHTYQSSFRMHIHYY